MKSSLFGSEKQSASFVLIELHLKRYLSVIFNKYLRNSVRCLATYIRRTHRGHFFVSRLWRRLDLPFPNMQGFLPSVPARGWGWGTGAKGNLFSFMCQKSWRHSGLTFVPSELTRFIPRCANFTGDLGSPQQGRCLQFTVLPLDLGPASFSPWP